MAENENTKDPATGLPPDYRHMFSVLEKILIEKRDEAQHDTETFPPLADYYKAQFSAYQLAIGAMHIVTNGTFGQSYADQVGKAEQG